MSFQSPWLLLGLLAIPLLVGFYLTSQRRRRTYAVRFTNLALLNQVMGKGPRWRGPRRASAFPRVRPASCWLSMSRDRWRQPTCSPPGSKRRSPRAAR
ncbi:MAG: hypothetical protein E6J07_06350 [Chloroflexi bacterium]|nr:MAG: hypothetical protein E6J07_06350 [Chloroflexota bacterium]